MKMKRKAACLLALIMILNVFSSTAGASEYQADKMYTVFISETEHGTVTVNDNEVSYVTLREGETVRVSAIPDDGYRTVSVTAYNSNHTAIAAESGREMEFTMIDDDVTVEAVFTENSLTDSQAEDVKNGADAETLQQESYTEEQTSEETGTEMEIGDIEIETVNGGTSEKGLCDVIDVTAADVINAMVGPMYDYLGTPYEEMNDKDFIHKVLSDAGNTEVTDIAALVEDEGVKTTVYEGTDFTSVVLDAVRHSDMADIFYVESIKNGEPVYSEYNNKIMNLFMIATDADGLTQTAQVPYDPVDATKGSHEVWRCI